MVLPRREEVGQGLAEGGGGAAQVGDVVGLGGDQLVQHGRQRLRRRRCVPVFKKGVFKSKQAGCGQGASAAQAADWPGLADAWGSLRHALALNTASGETADRMSRCQIAFRQRPRACEVRATVVGGAAAVWRGPAAAG